MRARAPGARASTCRGWESGSRLEAGDDEDTPGVEEGERARCLRAESCVLARSEGFRKADVLHCQSLARWSAEITVSSIIRDFGRRSSPRYSERREQRRATPNVLSIAYTTTETQWPVQGQWCPRHRGDSSLLEANEVRDDDVDSCARRSQLRSWATCCLQPRSTQIVPSQGPPWRARWGCEEDEEGVLRQRESHEVVAVPRGVVPAPPVHPTSPAAVCRFMCEGGHIGQVRFAPVQVAPIAFRVPGVVRRRRPRLQTVPNEHLRRQHIRSRRNVAVGLIGHIPPISAAAARMGDRFATHLGDLIG